VSKCPELSDAAVSQMITELEHLTQLNIRKCKKLSPKMRKFLDVKWKGIKIAVY
jgi:hypothetical protein